MERAKHGRGPTLAMGLAKMHLCVLCWDLMKHYVLELMISMCVFCWDLMKDYVLEFIIACVFCWTFVTDYVLELIIACVCVCSCKNHMTLLEPNVKLHCL
jgi:hypothetical protein